MARSTENHDRFRRTRSTPSWGLDQFSRVSGHIDLFHTSVDGGSFITLTIRRAKRHRGLSNYWVFGGEELIQVEEDEWPANQQNNHDVHHNRSCKTHWVPSGDGIPAVCRQWYRERVHDGPSLHECRYHATDGPHSTREAGKPANGAESAEALSLKGIG